MLFKEAWHPALVLYQIAPNRTLCAGNLKREHIGSIRLEYARRLRHPHRALKRGKLPYQRAQFARGGTLAPHECRKHGGMGRLRSTLKCISDTLGMSYIALSEYIKDDTDNLFRLFENILIVCLVCKEYFVRYVGYGWLMCVHSMSFSIRHLTDTLAQRTRCVKDTHPPSAQKPEGLQRCAYRASFAPATHATMLVCAALQRMYIFLCIVTSMARRKKRQKQKRDYFDDVTPQTKQAIAAIALSVLGIFFVLSALHYAGVAGAYTHFALTYLLGLGFFLAPVVCALYVYTLLRPREDERVSLAKMIGVAILFFSLLGILAIYEHGAGGVLGKMLAVPFSHLFGPLASVLMLSALALIGVFLTFNIGLSLPSFLRRRDIDEEDEEELDDAIAALPEDEEEEVAEEEEMEETEPVDEPARGGIIGKLGTAAGAGTFSVSNFYGPYDPPPLSLLEKDKGKARVGDVKANANIIKRTLQNFNIEVEMDEVSIGPSVTRYAIKPAEGVRIARIVGLQSNLELALAAHPVRIEAPIPGKSLVGIEVPNSAKATVGLASLLASPEYTDSPKPLLVALGKDISGKANFANIAKMPHTLIAGTTGSGKSVTIHALVTSLLFRNSPEQLRFIMVDPKRVELTLYNGIPHLLTPVITDAKKAILSLKWAAKEMERRYDILQAEKVRDLASYHEKVYFPARDAAGKKRKKQDEDADDLPEPLPYIVIIIDELADIMQAYPRELEAAVVRLAQMSRAVGIHLILSTQRPSVNVITGLIKANVPSRIALQVASQIDSRTILDQPGAEKLLGAGDMLFLSGELSKPARIQSAFLTEEEVKKVTDYLREQHSAHELDSIDLSGDGKGPESDAFFEASVDDDDDDLYEEAREIVVSVGKASTSYLQRRLRIGYSRAARLIDLLEERGVIGPADGSRPREILAGRDSESDEDEQT